MKQMMKCLLLVTGALMTQTAFGQVQIGVKAGATFSDVTTSGLNFGTGFLEPEMIASPYAGVYADIPLVAGFYFAPEGNYRQKGFKVREATTLDVFGLPLPIGAEAITRLDYIDIPLMLKYKIGDGNVQPYIKAGPTLGYAVSGSVTTRINSIIDIKVAEIDLNTQGELYNAFEVGGMVGAGVEIPTTHGSFIIDAMYSHGFTDVLNEPAIDLRVYNRAFSVGIGYAIRF